MGGDPGFVYDLNAYDYTLPDDLIAQEPLQNRESSRLMVLERRTGGLAHCRFADIQTFLRPGDLLVVNDTRVVPARLFGRKESGGRVEILILDPYKQHDAAEKEGYECLVKCSKPVKPGMRIYFENNLQARVLLRMGDGKAMLRLHSTRPLLEVLEDMGQVPLPPYIRRGGSDGSIDDRHSYQTVYAKEPGAVAAPTAGLHFTRELLERLSAFGVDLLPVTLHVGYGTFAPLRVNDVREHSMHSEYVEVSEESAAGISEARRAGRRIVAVGTTAVRTLEWVALNCGEVQAFSGSCNHYIYPGYEFKVVDAVVTNFHLPKSSLILLVSALAGRENILKAYETAVAEGYRFFSYGDAMLIL